MNAHRAPVASLTHCTVGIDIGGTKTLGVAVGPGGDLLAETLLMSGYGPGGVIDAVAEAVERLRAAVPGLRVGRVGVGIPGTVDHRLGEVRQALNLGIEDLALGAALRARLGLPVHVENDVNVAALGAASNASSSAPVPAPAAGRSLAYLNLGTGLAVGLVLDGQLWRGVGGAAGEIGHIPIDPAGDECVCGLRGCLELYASGSGIARQWGADVPMVAAIAALAADGDARAGHIMGQLIWGVASAARLIVLTHDVDRVVLGGGIVAALGDRLLDPARELLRDWEASSAFLHSLRPSSRLSRAPAGVPVAAIGAALAASQMRVEQDSRIVVES